MSGHDIVLPLLMFEAADCLMAVQASEVGHLEKRLREPFSPGPWEKGSRSLFCDLGEYFGSRESDGPWLLWTRGTRRVWLRVRNVLDVTPMSLARLRPMPAVFGVQGRTQAFLAAGVCGDDVFLLLDPARLAS